MDAAGQPAAGHGPHPEPSLGARPAGLGPSRTKRLCGGYGFRFVNGRYVASGQRHCGDWAPCTSFAPIVQHPTPSIRPPWARPAVRSAVPAARRSGWPGRRMPSKSPAAVPAMAAASRRAGRSRRRRGMGGAGARGRGRRRKTPPSSTARRSRPTGPPRARPRASEADWPSVARADAEDMQEAAPGRRSAVRQPVQAAAAAARFRACRRSACPSPAPRWARWCWR